MSTQSFSAWLRHPGSIILIITVVLMVVVVTDQSRQKVAMAPGMMPSVSPSRAPTIAPPVTTNPPAGEKAQMGGELPKIVQQLNAPSMGMKPGTQPAGAPGRLQAPDLGSLLGRLEDKVKTDPSNIGNRLLLAQTYNELGLGDKALEEVRAALTQAPDHGRAQLVLASILSARKNEEGLNEAKALLEGLKFNVEIKQYLVAMYLGDTFIRLGNRDAALKSWNEALEAMPATDNRRTQIEKRIADLSSGTPEA